MKVSKIVSLMLLLALLLSTYGLGVAGAAPPPQEEGQDYVVKEGDTLSALAEENFGDMDAYPVIMIATNLAAKEDPSYAIIAAPEALEVGDKLRIPPQSWADEYLNPPAADALGSEEKPIQLYFVPSVEAEVIVESGEAMGAYFLETAGIHVEVSVPTSYAAVIEAMGAAEGDIMAFIPALAYVLAHERYDVDVALAVVRYGRSWYATQFVVARDSDLPDFGYDPIPEEYNGKIWAFPDEGSTSGYLYPKAKFMKDGVEPGEELATGGHPQTTLAIYDGSADVGTNYYSPPGDTVEDWAWGDPPEPEGDIEIVEEEGTLKAYKGGLRLRDARDPVLDTAPDVYEKVRIAGLSPKIPNDTVSFVADFPPILRYKLVKALLAYAETEEGQAVLSNPEFYDITGFEEVPDSTYDPVRDLVQYTGMNLEEKYGLE